MNLFSFRAPSATLVLLACMSVLPAPALPVHYTFNFQTSTPDVPVPTGSFVYDRSIFHFSDFHILFNGVDYDMTTLANYYGQGDAAFPFELGRLAGNLIDGYGPLGPELSHWYAGPSGFYGFEWRTPAEDFLTFSFSTGVVNKPLYRAPSVWDGTWSTTASEVPEPGAFCMTLSALAVVGTLAARIRRRRIGYAAISHGNSDDQATPPSPLPAADPDCQHPSCTRRQRTIQDHHLRTLFRFPRLV